MNPNPIMIEEQKKNKAAKRRRRELILILTLLLGIGLLLFFQTHISHLGDKIPVTSNILVISLIGINVLLFLLLVFLILRNIVKLIFERRKKVLGAKLKTKLVLAFGTLTLVPTIVLFIIAIQFITWSIENWFSVQVEGSLQESLVVAQVYYQDQASSALHHGRHISQAITQQRMLERGHQDLLAGYLKAKLGEYNLGAIEIIIPHLTSSLFIRNPNLASVSFPPLESKLLQEAFRGKETTRIQSIGQGDLIRGLVPVFSPQNPREVNGVLAVVYFIPQSLVSRVSQISTAFEDYKQLSALKNPIKFSYLITLSLVTLLLIFSATSFGLFLAKGITEPVQKLVEGTQKIVKGNLDFAIPKTSGDEIGTLVDSFNQMTRDLKFSKSQVEKAHAELSKSNLELDQRRRYMEVVLRDVGTGVISLDSVGKVRTINRSAEKILGIHAEQVLGKDPSELLQGEYLQLANDLIQAVNRAENHSISRQIKLRVQSDLLTLLVKVAMLRDEEDRYLGMVVVLDDLTQLQKAQRAEAWREVARRIAHEIKNPLTPIQLSAQRLRKRYLNQFGQNGAIFDECTRTIITQVEELKNLVNEFSSFARMPAANPMPNNLNEIIREAMVLFVEGHKNIRFEFIPDDRVPVFNLDKEQIKRVIVNLLDNAVAAVDAVAGKDGAGQITINTQLDPLMNLARIEVADNGCGVAPEDKPLLFEPYFSTKPSGTGLGLAIVNTIISDHHGYARVRDNVPRGTRLIIELPIHQ
ncbi:MAG: PAS domain-containing protein [Syntrophaceae bacterium]|nr:PAS domain-containing protein [Syntrophaceae bacterium]